MEMKRLPSFSRSIHHSFFLTVPVPSPLICNHYLLFNSPPSVCLRLFYSSFCVASAFFLSVSHANARTSSLLSKPLRNRVCFSVYVLPAWEMSSFLSDNAFVETGGVFFMHFRLDWSWQQSLNFFLMKDFLFICSEYVLVTSPGTDNLSVQAERENAADAVQATLQIFDVWYVEVGYWTNDISIGTGLPGLRNKKEPTNKMSRQSSLAWGMSLIVINEHCGNPIVNGFVESPV